MPRPHNPEWKKKWGNWVNQPQEMPSITNKMFVADKDFIEACGLAGVSPTSAQARKYRHQRGSAYNAKREADQQKRLASV